MAHRYVLSYFICAFGLVAGQSPEYALKGQEVKLMPSISGHPDDILWKHNSNKIVAFNGQEEQVLGTYENRVTLNWITADLTITHLTYEDSGDYELEITKGGHVDRSHYKLEVIDKVAKPTISCKMIDSSGSDKPGIQAILICSAESSRPQPLTKFEWSSRPGRPVQPGVNLTISLGDEHNDDVYNCKVSNPSSSDIAAFTAKDCYPEKSSSVGLIVSLIILFVIIALLLFLGFMFRRKLVNALPACCVIGQTGDLEKQSLPGTVKGSDKKTSQDEETPFLDRAPTLPSKQLLRPLVQTEPNDSDSEHKEANHSDPDIIKGKNEDKPLLSPDPEPTSHVDVNTEPVHHASKDKEEDADVVREPTENEPPTYDSLNSEEANKPDFSEDLQCDVQSSTAPEQTESEKEADEDDEIKSAPASHVPPPSPRLCPSMTRSSPHMSREDITANLKEDANLDQVTGETAEKNHLESTSADESSEEKQSSTISDQKGSETTADEQDSHLAHGESDTRDNNQQETDKPVSEDVKECDDLNDQEAIDKAQNQSLVTSQQSQSATLTTPDNSNTNTCQESPDTAQAESAQENKTTHDSDESERQPDSSTAKEDKREGQSVEEKKEVQCGPKEESQAT